MNSLLTARSTLIDGVLLTNNVISLSLFFPFLTNSHTKGQPQEPLVRKSSQPKKSPVVAEAPPVEPEPAGAAAVVPPPVIEQSPPVTSPEVGTDSEAGGKGKFHLLIVENNFP